MPEKENNNSTTNAILVILLVVLVGFGVYYFVTNEPAEEDSVGGSLDVNITDTTTDEGA